MNFIGLGFNLKSKVPAVKKSNPGLKGRKIAMWALINFNNYN